MVQQLKGSAQNFVALHSLDFEVLNILTTLHQNALTGVLRTWFGPHYICAQMVHMEKVEAQQYPPPALGAVMGPTGLQTGHCSASISVMSARDAP